MIRPNNTLKERCLSAVEESISYGIWVCSADGKCLYASPMALKALGAAQPELTDNWLSYVHPEDAPVLFNDWRRWTSRGAGTLERMFRFRFTDQKWHWVMLRACPIRDEHGRVSCFGGLLLSAEKTREKEDGLRASEQRLRLMAETLPYGIWMADPEGRMLYLSPSFLGATGLTMEQAQGYGWLRAFATQEEASRTLDRFLQSVKAGEPYEALHFLRGVDGVQKLVLCRGQPVRNPEGQVVCWVGINLDRTESSREEENVRRSEERLRTLASTIPAIIWTADTEGRITYVNERYLQEMGVKLEEVLGEGWTGQVHPEDVRELLGAWRRAVEEQTPFQYEARFQTTEGHRWYLMRAHTCVDKAGNVLEWCGTSLDVHERHEAEVALQIAKDQAETDARAKAAFLLQMTESLRKALTSVSGFAKTLQDNPWSTSADQYVGHILKGSKSLSETLNSVLEFARLEGRVVQFRPSRVDLVAAARETVHLFQTQAIDKGISIGVESRQENVWVEADWTALSRVLFNVVSNAVKVTEMGNVILTVRPEGNGGAIEVQDTGPGITAAVRETLFSPVWREGHDRKKGSGLGLAIARQLVECMGGTIRVDSEPGAGAIFTIWLPARRGSRPVAPPRHLDFSEIKAEPAPAPKPVAEKPKPAFLFIGGDQDTCRSVEIVFQREANLTFADDTQVGLFFVGKDHYDAVFVDADPPKGSEAAEFIQLLRQEPNGAHLPAVALSSSSEIEDLERLQAAGFNDLLQKPLARDAVEALMQRLANPEVS